MAGYMLTTTDNPFSPVTQFDEWYAWDISRGYNTCGLLARFNIRTNQLSAADSIEHISDAMDRIIEINPTGNYIKVPIK